LVFTVCKPIADPALRTTVSIYAIFSITSVTGQALFASSRIHTTTVPTGDKPIVFACDWARPFCLTYRAVICDYVYDVVTEIAEIDVVPTIGVSTGLYWAVVFSVRTGAVPTGDSKPLVFACNWGEITAIICATIIVGVGVFACIRTSGPRGAGTYTIVSASLACRSATVATIPITGLIVIDAIAVAIANIIINSAYVATSKLAR